MKIEDAIRFSSQVAKLQTTVDGGWSLTLHMGQLSRETITALSDARQPGVILEVAAVAVKPEKQEHTGNNGRREIQARAKRKSEWSTAKVQSIDGNT